MSHFTILSKVKKFLDLEPDHQWNLMQYSSTPDRQKNSWKFIHHFVTIPADRQTSKHKHKQRETKPAGHR